MTEVSFHVGNLQLPRSGLLALDKATDCIQHAQHATCKPADLT